MGIPTLITTETADGDTSVSITSGIDGTYDEYMFVFTDMHTNSNDKSIYFGFSDDGGSSYAVTKTTTLFEAIHNEGDTSAVVRYQAGADLAQSTTGINYFRNMGSVADESGVGIFHLFNPASTTYVKHFYTRTHEADAYDGATSFFLSGYLNTTSAINAVQFTPNSGTFDGVIQLFGIA